MTVKRNTMDIFEKAKKERRKITMVTCYDYSMARLVDQTDIDSVLIGDSLGMTMLGYESTLPVLKSQMPEFDKGYLDALVRVQTDLYGTWLADDLITQERVDAALDAMCAFLEGK